MHATATLTQQFTVDRAEKLPDGATCLIVRLAGHGYADWWNRFSLMPAALEFAGRTFGRSGWDSDTGRCFYRDDHATAQAAITTSGPVRVRVVRRPAQVTRVRPHQVARFGAQPTAAA